MKTPLLFALLSFIVGTSYAQVCSPDPSFTNSGPGVYPVTVATPDCSDTLAVKTIVSITDTTVNVTNPIVLDVTIYYDSSRVVSVTGLPAGLSFGTDVDGVTSAFAPYGAWVNGGSIPNVTPAVGCVYVYGSPAAWQAAQLGGSSGVYTIQVEYDARITQTSPDVSAFGIPPGTWLSAVNPALGGGTITINVPMDTHSITNLAYPAVSGSASAFINTAETYTATSNGSSFNWTVVGGTIQSGQGTDQISVLWDGGIAEGEVTVEVGDGEGCTKSESYQVAVAGVGISEADRLHTSVFPNPSKDVFNIRIESTGIVHLSVLDLSGKTLRTEQFSGQAHHLDLSAFPSGAYLLKLEAEEGTSVSRLILE